MGRTETNFREGMKERTTVMIHKIIEVHGSHDNRALMKDLKDLRREIILEVHYEYGRRLRGVKTNLEELY